MYICITPRQTKINADMYLYIYANRTTPVTAARSIAAQKSGINYRVMDARDAHLHIQGTPTGRIIVPRRSRVPPANYLADCIVRNRERGNVRSQRLLVLSARLSGADESRKMIRSMGGTSSELSRANPQASVSTSPTDLQSNASIGMNNNDLRSLAIA